MTVSITPTILTSKTHNGSVPSTRFGNVAWNDDGQCLFLTRKDVTIMTPYIVSSLAPPPSLVDPNLVLETATTVMNKSAKKALRDEAMDDDMQVEGSGEGTMAPKAEVKRPKTGELKWWINNVDLAPDTKKDARYNWGAVGSDNDYLLHDEEIRPRQAVWSPSGFSDLGGCAFCFLHTHMAKWNLDVGSCMMAVLSTAGQVSVYAPRGDPIRTQWDEVADLTAMTKNLRRSRSHALTPPDVYQMQTTFLAWSPAVPLDSAIGLNGSLLALANRADGIALWSYGQDRRFRRSTVVQLDGVCASSLAWSAWRETSPYTCESRLTFSTPDGAVGIVIVRQNVESTAGKITTEIMPTTYIDSGDRRHVSALSWSNDILVWTKPGSVHLWSDKASGGHWNGVKAIRLARVGSWAGCNALAACVGIDRISPSSIAITLSTLSVHIIHDLDTDAPHLATAGECLVASLAARQAFVDHVQGDFSSTNKVKLSAEEVQHLTAYTCGSAGVGAPGLATANWEVINFHNLDYSNEGKRITAFAVYDMSDSLPGPKPPAIDVLRQILADAGNPLIQASSRRLLPAILRLMSDTPEPENSHDRLTDLLELCEVHPGQRSTEVSGGLTARLFGSAYVNTLRLRYTLALWAQRAYPPVRAGFESRAISLLQALVLFNTQAFVSHVAGRITADPAGSTGTQDQKLLRSLIDSATRAGLSPNDQGVTTLRQACPAAAEGATAERCRACRQPVDGGDLSGNCKCLNGHEWTRCSVTGLLITKPLYRTCTTCPAISLLPSRILTPPKVVDEDGRDHDYERFARSIDRDEALIQQLLESCQSCIICGGRWIRAM